MGTEWKEQQPIDSSIDACNPEAIVDLSHQFWIKSIFGEGVSGASHSH